MKDYTNETLSPINLRRIILHKISLNRKIKKYKGFNEFRIHYSTFIPFSTFNFSSLALALRNLLK
jgi:hypothetical protein